MGIYDIFASAAKMIERTPWQTRLLAGSLGGATIEGLYGDPNTDLMSRLGQGMFVGGAAVLGAGVLTRAAGVAAAGGERLGRAAISSKIASVKTGGYKALLKPGTLALGGAALGAMAAPSGYKTQGAVLGGAVGFSAIPAMKLFKGYEALGKIPGAQTASLIAAASIPVAAAGVFGHTAPETEAYAMPGPTGIDYTPMDGGMKDKMIAMSATGDIVFGLHGRAHN